MIVTLRALRPAPGEPPPPDWAGRWPSVGFLVAAVALGGHKAVAATAAGVAPASASDPACLGRVVGITREAALAGALVAVLDGGPIEEPTWSWAPGPVFVGEAGALTQTPPLAGFVQQVAIATGPTRVLVALGTPFKLAP